MKKYIPLIVAVIAETLFAFRILTKAIKEGSHWKITLSAIGFSIMLIMTIYFLIRINAKRKV
ncbi:MAG TPA: hypothetical protein VIN08_16430 [Ohtaekwangia sp.]|uniref:hypothetical protein n=1 Tax=Ohtaekwangia sp. TaxID=2066019 RepID=UPI002F928BE1